MDDLGFNELPLSGAERKRELEKAAKAIDALAVEQGVGAELGTTPQGDFARDFMYDEALPKRPGVFRVSPEAVDSARHDIPVDVEGLFKTARFYWIWLPVRLYSRAGWGFNRLDVRAVFSTGTTGGAGATTLYLLPDPVFMTFFEGREQLQLGIDSRLKARAALPPIAAGQPGGPEVEFDAGGGVEVTTAGKYVFGPFDYRLTAAKVKHFGAGDNDARWRLDGARYLDEGDPGLRVMLRVPNEAKELSVRISVSARRYFAALDASFQEKILAIGEAIGMFLRNGAPIGAVGEFDLKQDM